MINKISCSNVSYFYYDTDFFFKTSSEIGFKNAELYLGTPHIFIDGRTVDEFCNISLASKKFGLKITSVRPETLSFRYGLCYLDKRWNDLSMNAYMNCIDYANRINVKELHTDITGVFRDYNRENIYKQAVDNFKQIVKYGKKNNITVSVEAELADMQSLITSLPQMKNFVEAVNDENLKVGINMDTLEKEAETIEQWNDAFKERISHIRCSSLKQTINLESKNVANKEIVLFNTQDSCLDKPQVHSQSEYELICKRELSYEKIN